MRGASVKRILIVDDEPIIRSTLARYCERQRMTALQAKDFSEATAALAAPAYRANAVHMACRLALAGGLALLTADAVRTPDHARRLLLTATVSGALVAVLVMATSLLFFIAAASSTPRISVLRYTRRKRVVNKS